MHRILLLLLLVIALGVYLWGIQRNLPYAVEADESIYVERAITMADTGNPNPGWFGNPGSTTFYPLATIYHLWHAISNGHSLFTSDKGLAEAFEQDRWIFYLLGRYLSVSYAVLSLPFLYLIGKQIFDRRTAILGLLFSIFSGVTVYYAQIVRTDTAALFFGLVSLWLCLRLLARPSLVGRVFAGLSIGLAMSSRYFMVNLIPILIAVEINLWWQHPQRRKEKGAWAGVILGMLCIGIGFALTSPYVFLDFSTALMNIRLEARTEHWGADGLSPIGNFIWYLINPTLTNLTWIQSFFAMVGIVVIFRRRQWDQWLMIGFILIFLSTISLSALHWGRWLIQILPLMSLIAAHGLENLTGWIVRIRALSPRLAQMLFTGVVVITLAWPVWRTTLLNIRLASPSTRIEARAWMQTHLPPGSRIAQEIYTAPLVGTEFIVSEWPWLAQQPLTFYTSGEYDYVVVGSDMYQNFFADPGRYADEVNFYTRLFREGELIQSFEPSAIKAGPTIKIYRIISPR